MDVLQEECHEITLIEKGLSYQIDMNNIKVMEVFNHKLSILMKNGKMEIRGSLAQYETELLN